MAFNFVFGLFFLFSGKMINLFKVKAKQRETAENVNGKTPVKKQTAGELRLHKGIDEGDFHNIHIFS